MKAMNDMTREYAEALFALACEENSAEEYSKALGTIAEVMHENPQYMDFLVCPGIPVTERLGALEEAFSGRIPDYVLHFMQLLCEKGRIRLFDGCVREYNMLLDASHHVAVARVTSAVELTAPEKERITAKLEKITGKSVALECYTDPAIMGGVVIETEGRAIDGSLRRHLHEVKDVIGR